MVKSKEGFIVKNGVKYRTNRYGVIVGKGMPIEQVEEVVEDEKQDIKQDSPPKPVPIKKGNVSDQFKAVNEKTKKALEKSDKEKGN